MIFTNSVYLRASVSSTNKEARTTMPRGRHGGASSTSSDSNYHSYASSRASSSASKSRGSRGSDRSRNGDHRRDRRRSDEDRRSRRGSRRKRSALTVTLVSSSDWGKNARCENIDSKKKAARLVLHF